MKVDPNGRGPRLLGMMGIVLACALGFGAIKSPSDFGGLAVLVCTLAILIVATLGAIFSTPKPFWAGLAIVGWASMPLATRLWLDYPVVLFRPFPRGMYYETSLPLIALYGWWNPSALAKSVDQFNHIGIYSNESIMHMTAYTQVAVIQGVLGGLVAMGLEHRGRNGRNLAETMGRPIVALIAVACTVSVVALGFLYEETPWGDILIQAVHVLLIGSIAGSVAGQARGFWRGYAAFGALALLVMVRHGHVEAALGLSFRQDFMAYLESHTGWLATRRTPRMDEVADHVSALAVGLLGGMMSWVIDRRIAKGRTP